MWLDGRNVTTLPLEERRDLLAHLPFTEPLHRVVLIEDSSPWERAQSEGWEGVIAKRRGSIYEHRRSKEWLKMKCELSQNFLVGGFTDPQGKRVGLGALLVGYNKDDDFVFAGKIGTGFDTKLFAGPACATRQTRITQASIHESHRFTASTCALGEARDRRQGWLHRVDSARQTAPSASTRSC